jgi:hypothetical protein
MSSEVLQPTIQRASNSLTAEETARYAEWLGLQDNFVNIATRVTSAVRLRREDGDDITNLELALQELRVFAQKSHDWHGQSNNIDDGNDPPGSLDSGAQPSQEFKRNEYAESAPCADIEDVPDVIHPKVTDVKHDYAALYYKAASAVRYLSDDLINLGPPPANNIRHAADSNDGEDDSEILSPHEYAEEHLRLLKEINNAREEAAKYKQLCSENGIELDGDSDDEDFEADVDSQTEDVYRSILSEREFATSRIDFMMAVQAQRPSTFPTAILRTAKAFRTAEWAATQNVANIDEVIASPQSTGIWTPPMTSVEDNVSINGSTSN